MQDLSRHSMVESPLKKPFEKRNHNNRNHADIGIKVTRKQIKSSIQHSMFVFVGLVLHFPVVVRLVSFYQ